MTPKAPEHDETKSTNVEHESLDALYERFLSDKDFVNAIRLSAIASYIVAFTSSPLKSAFPVSPAVANKVRQWYAEAGAVYTQATEEAQDSLFVNLQPPVEEAQDMQQALNKVERLVADMRLDQGEIDMLRTDTRRTLAKLMAE
jgi:hypothetical protein